MEHLPLRSRLGSYGILTSAVAFSVVCWAAAGCSKTASPQSPTVASTPTLATPSQSAHALHPESAPEDHGFIDGWFEGSTVQLYYTKSYFCAEPPSSGAPSDCEIGAPAEIAPRSGPIPKIYAIAAVGFKPDPTTLACPAGSTCLDHPAMIDASRVAGPGATSIPGVPHSHIVDGHHAGWFNTVNIRV